MDYFFPTPNKDKMPLISSTNIKSKWNNVIELILDPENKGKKLVLREPNFPHNK